MDSFPKKTLIVALVIILMVILISSMGTAAFSSLFYQGVPDDRGWTPPPSRTPTDPTSANQELLITELTPTSWATSEILPTATFRKNCTYPAEYWLEHADTWPVYTILGNFQYSPDDIQKILTNQSTLVRDDLVLQMYFAYLNIQNNAGIEDVDETLDDANFWLTTYANTYPLSDDARVLGITLAGVLGKFNDGLIGPGPCEPYQAPTRTPVGIGLTLTSLATPTPTATLTPTRYFVTVQPLATMIPTATKRDADKPRWPTNTPGPVTNTPVPQEPTSTKEPPPTDLPTSAPPEDTAVPTQPPEPTDPPQPSTPTPAS